MAYDGPMTTESAPIATAAHWGIPEPVAPVLPQDQVLNFLQNAPGGSLVEIFDDIYQKSPYKNEWLHLNDVLDYEYNRSTPEQLMQVVPDSGLTQVFVLRIGEGGYSSESSESQQARIEAAIEAKNAS